MWSLIEARDYKRVYMDAVLPWQRAWLGRVFQNKENIIGRKRHLNAFYASWVVRQAAALLKAFQLFARRVICFDCRYTDMKPDRILHQTKLPRHWYTRMEIDIYMIKFTCEVKQPSAWIYSSASIFKYLWGALPRRRGWCFRKMRRTWISAWDERMNETSRWQVSKCTFFLPSSKFALKEVVLGVTQSNVNIQTYIRIDKQTKQKCTLYPADLHAGLSCQSWRLTLNLCNLITQDIEQVLWQDPSKMTATFMCWRCTQLWPSLISLKGRSLSYTVYPTTRGQSRCVLLRLRDTCLYVLSVLRLTKQKEKNKKGTVSKSNRLEFWLSRIRWARQSKHQDLISAPTCKSLAQ